MAEALFSTLYNRLSPSAPGVPQPVAVDYIRRAAIESCERTLAYRYNQAAITSVAGTISYAFTPASNTAVHAVLGANVDGSVLSPATLEQILVRYPSWPDASADKRGTPRFFTHINPQFFDVAPAPDTSAYEITMILALKPTTSSTGMEQAYLDELEDVILHGALQHLLVLPERPWSDRELAAYHAKQFAYKISERRARTNMGPGRGTVSVRMSPLA